ncbi:metal-dependent hydrolase [Cylindrospermopsis curvispora]|uniref:Metal-dependent hydrolase n=1 Tax=Cylindrospermopsis curvispora GIHE-G1 TaxID=2666332 RepID=A0A7H0F5P2_9CYAN|nr:metal-dependent hydrolase [Cylindrospermopsis curvispora]QNP31358.1 metal-dependent hydrolase [Cylindrospermopsis curvispora GIHE-G1]
MLAVSHVLVSGLATSIVLNTSDPIVIAVGGIAGLFPDIDTPKSIVGRLFPFISNFLTAKMRHRSCTHSLLASFLLALIVYPISYFFNFGYQIPSAIVCGYIFGWLADMFTKNGVEVFWPSKTRYVCPANRKFRLTTGSNAEYVILFLLILIAYGVFYINYQGGFFQQFNQIISSPSGVVRLYMQHSKQNKILLNIEGTDTTSRNLINKEFTLIQPIKNDDLIVLDEAENKLYLASERLFGNIVINRITARVGPPVKTQIKDFYLEDESINDVSLNLNTDSTVKSFLSGDFSVDEFDISNLGRDSSYFNPIEATTTRIKLTAAPFNLVINQIGDEFLTGSLKIFSISDK